MSILLIILLIALYFLPSILGWSKRNAGAIMILNLLLGWTVIGWIVALIWSISNDSQPQVIIVEKKKKKKKKAQDEKIDYDNSNDIDRTDSNMPGYIR